MTFLNISRWFHSQKRKLGIESVQWGSLRRLQPISRNWGYDRGLPIDRYYIESFLREHHNDIRGRVLEFQDSYYTRKYGGNRVIKSEVLNVENDIPQSTIVADLADAGHIPSEIFDCIICTQVLQLIYDLRSAVYHLNRILKPDGVILASFPIISKIAQEWDDYWRFTPISALRLFNQFFPLKNISVNSHGNVLTSIAFLHGFSTEELENKELDYRDPEFTMLITVRAVKPLGKK